MIQILDKLFFFNFISIIRLMIEKSIDEICRLSSSSLAFCR